MEVCSALLLVCVRVRVSVCVRACVCVCVSVCVCAYGCGCGCGCGTGSIMILWNALPCRVLFDYTKIYTVLGHRGNRIHQCSCADRKPVPIPCVGRYSLIRFIVPRYAR